MFPTFIEQPGGAGGSSSTSINVQDYGAEGDAKKVTDAASTNGSTTVTSASGLFTAADVGKVIWGVKTSTKALAVPLGTIATYVSATQITVSVAATSTETGLHLVWGTNDTAAIQAAHAAAMAMQPRGLVTVPAGGYIFDEVLFDFTEAAPVKSGGVLGAGSGSTIFYPSPAHDLAGTSMLAKTTGNNNYTRLEGFAVDGCYFEWAATFKNVIQLAGFLMETVRDVRIEFVYGVTDGIKALGYFTSLERVYVESSASYGVTLASGGSAFVSDSVFANCINFSLNIESVAGTANTKSFVRVLNSWVDESGSGALYVTGSTDVVLEGVRVSGPVGAAGLQIVSSSVVHAIGCELLPWGTTGNRPGADVASGCVLHATNCRFDAAGTGNALTNAGTVNLSNSRLSVLGSGVALANTGTANDLGGNVIASSSGTAAVRDAGLTANTFTGVQTLPNGAVGAPALNFGDATSGLYRNASNEVSISTAGVLRVQVGSGAATTFWSAGTLLAQAAGEFGYNAFHIGRDIPLGWKNDTTVSANADLFLRRAAAASLQLGANTAVNSATAIAQTIKGPNATGTTATGGSLTLAGGTGTSAGGAVILAASATTGAPATAVTVNNNAVTTFAKPPVLPVYTVATLPATAANGMVQGAHAVVTDATAPTYLGALTGGGAVVCPVFYNGTAWVSH
jgi:hypothetical protein